MSDQSDFPSYPPNPPGSAFAAPSAGPQGGWAPAPPPPPGDWAPGYSGGYGGGYGGFDLPAGVQLASAGRRVGAYLLCFVLFVVTLGIGYIIWSFVLWPKGTSPAYRLLGMTCWHLQSRRVAGFGEMALREVVGRVVIMSVIPIVSFIASVVSFVLFLARSDRQGIPDLISGTIVVYDPGRVLG